MEQPYQQYPAEKRQVTVRSVVTVVYSPKIRLGKDWTPGAGEGVRLDRKDAKGALVNLTVR